MHYYIYTYILVVVCCVYFLIVFLSVWIESVIALCFRGCFPVCMYCVDVLYILACRVLCSVYMYLVEYIRKGVC